MSTTDATKTLAQCELDLLEAYDAYSRCTASPGAVISAVANWAKERDPESAHVLHAGEERCSGCGKCFPAPVSLHHHEADCGGEARHDG